jgi:hypothetical protein
VPANSARVKHLEPTGARMLGHGVQQRRLADPGRTLQDQDPALAGPHAIEQLAGQAQLAVAFEKHRLAPYRSPSDLARG